MQISKSTTVKDPKPLSTCDVVYLLIPSNGPSIDSCQNKSQGAAAMLSKGNKGKIRGLISTCEKRILRMTFPIKVVALQFPSQRYLLGGGGGEDKFPRRSIWFAFLLQVR